MFYYIAGQKIGACCKRNPEWISFLQSIEDLDFGHVELGLDETGCQALLDNSALVARVCGLLKGLDISSSLHSAGGTNLAEKVARIRQVSIDIVSESIDVAERIGSEWVTVHLGSAGIPNGCVERKRTRLDVAIDALENILRRTSWSSVRIAVENLPRMPDDWPLCRLGDRWEEFEYLFHSLPSERLGMVYDYGHARLYGSTSMRFAGIPAAVAPRVLAFHLHGNDGVEDRHASLVANPDDELESFLNAVAGLSTNAPVLLENYSLEEMLVTVETLFEMRSIKPATSGRTPDA
jgi:sugar phosphate isomerase/epimerase